MLKCKKIGLQCNNSRLYPHAVDISNREDVSAFTSETVYKCKNIYELINCAEIIHPFINLEKLELDYFEVFTLITFSLKKVIGEFTLSLHGKFTLSLRIPVVVNRSNPRV